MEEIARLAGCSLRTLQRAVRVLVARGLLVRTYLPGPRDRFDRKRSQWLVPYEATERGPVACAVGGRMHGPWRPGEAPVWSRYAPKRARPDQRFETRRKPSEPQRVVPSLPSDKSASPSFPTGTGGGDPPSPPPEPEENASAVRAAVAASLKCEAGGGPPASPRFTASRAIARPLRSGALRRRATGRGARPPNPCKPLGRLPRIDRHRPRSNGHGLQLQHVSSNVERTNARTGDFAPNSSASRNWTRRDVRSRRNCPRSRSRNRRARAAPSCRERGAPRCPTAARSRERCVARP
jgi:hypothetical protein